jgi:hypothetical protein
MEGGRGTLGGGGGWVKFRLQGLWNSMTIWVISGSEHVSVFTGVSMEYAVNLQQFIVHMPRVMTLNLVIVNNAH